MLRHTAVALSWTSAPAHDSRASTVVAVSLGSLVLNLSGRGTEMTLSGIFKEKQMSNVSK